MKVLLIDERSDTLEFFGESMESLGYKTGIAKGKSELFTLLAEESCEVILANGVSKELDFDRDIRSRFDAVHIVYLSASEDKGHHRQAGADIYLNRPFVASELRQAIRKPFTQH